jgi:hypothetical protein
MPDIRLAVTNVAMLVVRRVQKSWRRLSRAGRTRTKHALRQAEVIGRAPVVLARWQAASRARFVRTQRAATRFQDHVLVPFRDEREVDVVLRRLARGSEPIIVGPWISEVGYEVLYWVPFLRSFMDRYRVPADRLIAVSRGGVQSWYDGIVTRYVDLLSLVGYDEVVSGGGHRRSAGDQKQLDPQEWERSLVARAAARLSVPQSRVLYPGLMYRLFRAFWHGDRALETLLRRTDYRRVGVPHDIVPPPLPAEYAVVKFYTGPALPDSEQVRARLREIVARVAERFPIVSLDTGLALDEHEDYLFRDIPGVLSLRSWLTPERNLGQQTAVIAGARLFVGTCGSVAWLAPMLGVDTVAVYDDDRFLGVHMYAARYAYRQMDAARFSVLDLRAIDRVGGFRMFDAVHAPLPASAGTGSASSDSGSRARHGGGT